jgi:hypothetical protein
LDILLFVSIGGDCLMCWLTMLLLPLGVRMVLLRLCVTSLTGLSPIENDRSRHPAGTLAEPARRRTPGLDRSIASVVCMSA